MSDYGMIELLKKQIAKNARSAEDVSGAQASPLAWYERESVADWIAISVDRFGHSIDDAARGALMALAVKGRLVFRKFEAFTREVHVNFNREFDEWVRGLPGLTVVEEVGVLPRVTSRLAFWEKGFILWDSSSEDCSKDSPDEEDIFVEDEDDQPRASRTEEWLAASALRDTRSVSLYTIDDASSITHLADMFDRHVPPPLPVIHVNPGAAYLLCETMGGLQAISIGRAATPLVRDNYSPEAVAAYDFAIADLKKKDPIGRLTILEGAPGGGKTHMVQAMMGDVPDSKFIVVPPKMVKDLEDPGFVLTFLREAGISEDTGSPVVLVLEDADQCLTERKSDNMSSISAILNLSDGIVGKMMNIRVVATTNTLLDDKAMRLDAAVLRKGRLSARIKIGKVSAKQANSIWARVAGEKKKSAYKSPQILADIYESAKQHLLEKNGAA